MFQSIDPTTEKLFARRPLDTPDAVERKLADGERAFAAWRKRPVAERAGHLRDFATGLRDRRERFALLMTREMGKPIREARGEVDKAAWCFEHYADRGADYLESLAIESDARRSYVQHLPLGLVLGILPWNSPLWLAARCAAPALMAGNAVLIKHDPHVPACAEALESLAADVLPEGVWQFPFVDADGAGGVLRDRRVRAASFTGSTAGGQAVAAVAGGAAKPVVLELGGSDPAIVLADADLEAACATITTSRMINAGQSCIAAKRILVERSVYHAFVDDMASRLRELIVGEPEDEVTDIGPLARASLRDTVRRQVDASVAAGARCASGGSALARSGWFYEPTLLVDVPRDAAAMNEETFGPVAAVTPVDDAEDAVALANATRYGLAASIWTDTARAERLAADLEVGQVAVNGLVKTDPRLPSGGVKDSGIGRELGPHGIREFVNVQQVWVGPAR